MEQPIKIAGSPAELAQQFGARINQILTGRLAYYLGHLPDLEEFRRVRLVPVKDTYIRRYYYGQELILEIDMTNDRLVTFSAWEPITEAEVFGSAAGPGPVQRASGRAWDAFMAAQEIPIIHIPKDEVPISRSARAVRLGGDQNHGLEDPQERGRHSRGRRHWPVTSEANDLWPLAQAPTLAYCLTTRCRA